MQAARFSLIEQALPAFRKAARNGQRSQHECLGHAERANIADFAWSPRRRRDIPQRRFDVPQANQSRLPSGFCCSDGGGREAESKGELPKSSPANRFDSSRPASPTKNFRQNAKSRRSSVNQKMKASGLEPETYGLKVPKAIPWFFVSRCFVLACVMHPVPSGMSQSCTV